ncbi:type II secretion system F family protein [Haloactinopolyspora alba]|nr:type II secretion system F family protein [Haloactinopolyspora alba]
MSAAVLLTGPAPGVTRVRAILGSGEATRRHQRRSRPGTRDGRGWAASRRGRAVAVGCATLAGWTVVGGVRGVLLGAGAGLAVWTVLGRLEPAARARERERVTASVPLAADLLAATLAAGCPPTTALDVVGSAVGGPLGRLLLDARAASDVGADPARAMAPLLAVSGARPMARALVSTMSRGTSPVAALRRTAAEAREAARWAGEAKARSLGARAAAPLGLCFLPAFVLVGVVPMVATSGILGS